MHAATTTSWRDQQHGLARHGGTWCLTNLNLTARTLWRHDRASHRKVAPWRCWPRMGRHACLTTGAGTRHRQVWTCKWWPCWAGRRRSELRRRVGRSESLL